MKKINYLFIILTPFQKTVISQLFTNELKNDHSLVLLADSLDKHGLTCEIEYLKNYDFSQKKIFKNPFKYFKKTKLNVNEAKQYVKSLKTRYYFTKDLILHLGTDKDIFSQLFLNEIYLKDSNGKILNLVEEGMGYYVKVDFKDKIKALIYRSLTPILFNNRLFYIKRIGSYPKIDTIYLRAPELLIKKRRGVCYKKFKLGNQTLLAPQTNSDILLFSFPNQDYNITTEFKLKIIKQISSYLEYENKNLVIKPHPREDFNALVAGLHEIKNITILNNSFIGEKINYFDYEIVLNFFSSVILDLINKNYPKNKIFTIGFTKVPKVDLGEDLKYCYIHDFKASDFIKFEV